MIDEVEGYSEDVAVQTIYLIGGAFGMTKSHIIDYAQQDGWHKEHFVFVNKYSYRTDGRKLNGKLSPDLLPVTEQEFNDLRAKSACDKKHFFEYRFDGQHYGFPQSAVDDPLAQSKNVIIVGKPKHLYPAALEYYSKCRIRRVWVISTDECLKKDLERAEDPGLNTSWRLKRYREAAKEFAESPLGYDVLVYNGDGAELRNQFDRLVKHVPAHEIIMPDGVRCSLPNPYLAFRKNILKSVQANYESRVFVMMAYRPDDDSLRDEIKHAIEETGHIAVFGSDRKACGFDERNDTPILASCCCMRGIAVLDQLDDGSVTYGASTMFELGVWKWMGKRVHLFVAEGIKDLPFCLQGEVKDTFVSEADLLKRIKVWLKTL